MKHPASLSSLLIFAFVIIYSIIIIPRRCGEDLNTNLAKINVFFYLSSFGWRAEICENESLRNFVKHFFTQRALFSNGHKNLGEKWYIGKFLLPRERVFHFASHDPLPQFQIQINNPAMMRWVAKRVVLGIYARVRINEAAKFKQREHILIRFSRNIWSLDFFFETYHSCT